MKHINESEKFPKVIMKFSDGGTHHRNNLEAVKCSSICICKELDLDLFIGARCAPGQSWVNHAERVMSILNIGLQNFSIEASQEQTILRRISRSATAWMTSGSMVRSIQSSRLPGQRVLSRQKLLWKTEAGGYH